MSIFTDQEKVDILGDIVSMRSVNDIEIDTYMSRPPVYTTGQNSLIELAVKNGRKTFKHYTSN